MTVFMSPRCYTRRELLSIWISAKQGGRSARCGSCTRIRDDHKGLKNGEILEDVISTRTQWHDDRSCSSLMYRDQACAGDRVSANSSPTWTCEQFPLAMDGRKGYLVLRRRRKTMQYIAWEYHNSWATRTHYSAATGFIAFFLFFLLVESSWEYDKVTATIAFFRCLLDKKWADTEWSKGQPH